MTVVQRKAMFVRTIPESPLPALVPEFSWFFSGPSEAFSRHLELDSAQPIRIEHEPRAEKVISTLIGWFKRLLMSMLDAVL